MRSEWKNYEFKVTLESNSDEELSINILSLYGLA